jgi:Predicted nucleotide-binding protein containing TIR-like domain
LSRQGDTFEVARDNVVFELAMFVGMHGHSHAFIVATPDVRVPSDLGGITHQVLHLNHDPRGADQHDLVSDAQTAAGAIIDQIRRTIASHATERQPVAPFAPTPALTVRERVLEDLRAEARIGALDPVSDSALQGRAMVVHAVHGVGEVRGYDPPGEPNRFVWVDFDEPIGVALVPMSELRQLRSG